MSTGDLWLLVTAAVLVVLAGLFAAAEAALGGFSRARAGELASEQRAGAERLVVVLDDAPKYLNTALFVRMLCEIAAIVLVTILVTEYVDQSFWARVGIATGAMLVLSFVVVGVAPRTLGRQHADSVALWSAWPLWALTRILGPFPQLLILIGNAITPGRGFRKGPFSTETELRELVDIAEASAVIESEERRMIHSVFELGDTTVREVMVPRGDVVYIETYKNLRQTMSLFFRSGFSRVPVIGENLDDVQRLRLPQGRRPPRLRGPGRRAHPAGRGDHAARALGTRLKACRRPDARDAGATPARRRRRRRVRRHRGPDHDRGPARGDRR